MFCKRERGLIVFKENSPSIEIITDLKRRRIARRQENSKSHRDIEILLSEEGIHSKLVFESQKIFREAEELAMTLKSGHAEAALALRFIAQKYDFSFVLLFKGNFDLLFWNSM